MSPREFLVSAGKKPLAPVYLFLGPDFYTRKQVKDVLIQTVFGDDDPESGISRLDLDEIPFSAVLDDASALSLFAAKRLIWVSSAELALPKRITSKTDEEGAGALLAAYLKNPTPDTVIVFDCPRYGFEGEDKQKLERVRKFYAAVPAVVEFTPYSTADATRLVREVAKEKNLPLTGPQIEILVEALAADAGRITVELEKLSLFSQGRVLTDEELIGMIPNARSSNIFALVNALANGNRRQALDVLDVLVREGEYLPLVLTFLSTQFRLALAAAEANLRNAAQIQGHFSKIGVAMWRARAEQLAETIRVFPPSRLKQAISLTYCADRELRDTRPDDRTVMENFVWKLTAS